MLEGKSLGIINDFPQNYYSLLLVLYRVCDGGGVEEEGDSKEARHLERMTGPRIWAEKEGN